MTWWWIRLEAEGEAQRAALEAREAAKAQLDVKLRRKEEEVLVHHFFLPLSHLQTSLNLPPALWFFVLDFTSGISNGQTTVKGWARDCFHEEEEEVIWQRHHFHHDDVSKPSIHIITLFCGMMMSKELANIKFSMYINNVYSCLNTLFQHAYLIF